MVQQNSFQIVKFLDTSVKAFFSCNRKNFVKSNYSNYSNYFL